jgi:hypothetical protein
MNISFESSNQSTDHNRNAQSMKARSHDENCVTPDQVLYAICNMEMHTATLRKLEDKVLSVLENMGLNHHVFHNSPLCPGEYLCNLHGSNNKQ